MFTNETEVIGDDLVATPGHDLDSQELRLVLGLAEGVPPQQIAHDLGTTVPNLRDIENSATRKLEARSRGNLIARAFQLGVLQARRFTVVSALCITTICLLTYVWLHNSPHANSATLEKWAGDIRGGMTQDPRYNGKHLGQM